MSANINDFFGGNFFYVMDSKENYIEGEKETSHFDDVGNISFEPMEENDTTRLFANNDENEKWVDIEKNYEVNKNIVDEGGSISNSFNRKDNNEYIRIDRNNVLYPGTGDQLFENIDDEGVSYKEGVFEDDITTLGKKHPLNEFLNHNVERDLNDMNYINPNCEEPSDVLFSSFEKDDDPLIITKNDNEKDAEINHEFSHDPYDDKLGKYETLIDDDRGSNSNSSGGSGSGSGSSSNSDDEFDDEGDIINEDDHNR